MAGLVLLERPCLDAGARQLLYEGHFLVFRQVPALRQLCLHADVLVMQPYTEGVRSRGPSTAERPGTSSPSSPPTLALHREELIAGFEAHPHTRALFLQLIREVVGDLSPDTQKPESDGLEDLYWDRPRLRVQPPVSSAGDGLLTVDDIRDTARYGHGRFSCSLPLHRDTWANNVMCQLNWWAPVSELTPERGTLRVLPNYFRTPVQNTSAEWRFSTLQAKRKVGESYPQMPVCSVDARCQMVVLPEECFDFRAPTLRPGDLLLFSGAHLHGSKTVSVSLQDPVTSDSERTRFSLETRTVHEGDFRAGAGPANTDGRTPELTTSWFRKAFPREGESAGLRLRK